MIDPSLSQEWWIWWIMNDGWKIMKSLAYRGDHSANTIQTSVFKCIKLRKDAIVDLWISCVLSLTKKLLTQIDWGQGIKDALAKDKMATSRHPWLQPHKKPLRGWIENITQELVICQTVRPPGIQSRAEGYLSLMWGAYSLKKPHAILTPNTTGFSVKLDLQQSLEASLRKTEVGLSAATSLTPNNPVLESLLLLSHDVHPPLILCSHLFLPGLKVSLLLRARKVWTYVLSSIAIEVELGVWKGYWLMQCHIPSTRMSHIELHESMIAYHDKMTSTSPYAVYKSVAKVHTW